MLTTLKATIIFHGASSLQQQVWLPRALDEIQQRGAWRSHKSVIRYEKAARLQHSGSKRTPAPDGYLRTCESQIEEAFLKGRRVPLPPLLTLP